MLVKKGKRLPLLALILALLLSALPVSAAEPNFTDLDASWAGGEIKSLYQSGIYTGMLFETETLFQPNQPITRAEFLLVLFNAMGFDLKARDQALTAPFVDYAETPDAYKPYVIEGYNRGVMLGKSGADGALYSDWQSSLSRQEAVTIIGRVLNARSDSALPFTDSGAVAAWARDYLSALTGKGIINGMPDGSFAPSKSISRAEASHIVYLLLQKGMLLTAEIRIYAGTTELGTKDGTRLSATFGLPYGLSVAKDGSLLVADKDANTLRRIGSTAVSLLAGQTENTDVNGFPVGGYKDAVPANELMMRAPRYIAQAGDGTIYYTDGGNHLVRTIASDGKGYALSGTGTAGYANGTREKSQFNLPSGLAIASNGTIYVADTLNNCIRAIAKDGVTTLYAGVPGADGGYKDGALREAQFCQPTDIQFGADGALYVADTGNSMIRVIRDGKVSTLAGAPTQREELSGAMEGGYLDGADDTALFRGPLGLFVTSGGIVYVADTENNVIRKIENGFVTTVAGNLKAGNSTGPALVSMLNSPADVAVLAGKIYVSDTNNHCIKVFGTGLDS